MFVKSIDLPLFFAKFGTLESNHSEFMNIENLYHSYYKHRESNLRIDEFQYLVAILPALLIAQADGEIQEAEQAFIDRASREIAEGFAEDSESGEVTTDVSDIVVALQEELSFLVHHLEEWEQPFLSTLKEMLSVAIGLDTLIREMMMETAQAHPSPELLEQKKLDEIIQFLGI